jgi:putative ABC transport system permease protein
MDFLWRDLRLSVRVLAHARAYALAVIGLIALGVTAGTVLFTLYKGALLDPWPYDGGDRLLVFRGEYANSRLHPSLWSAADFAELRDLDVFDHVIAGRGRDVNLAAEGGAERVLGAALTPEAFTMLGVPPIAGRTLRPDDAQPGAAPVVVIGYGLWQRRYAGDPAAVGRTLPVDGTPHVIVGVMPPRFLWWGSELWLPMPIDLADARRDRRQYVVQARLRQGVDLAQASAVLDTWARRVEQAHAAEYPEYRGWRAQTDLLVHAVLRDVRDVLRVLAAAVALLVLIAGFNVANLLVARAAERQREFAVRVAIGASHAVMARALVVENLLLATIGGITGVAGAALCTGLVVALIPYGYLPAEANVALDARVVAVAAGLALVLAVLAAIPAAASLRRLPVAAALNEARGTGSRAAIRVRSAFVVAQLALAIVVVSVAAAVGGSFRDRLAVDSGFDAEGAASMRVSLPSNAYPDRPALRQFALRLEERLAAMPGVEAAGIGIARPLAGGPIHPLSLRARPEETALDARYEVVAGDWFHALGVRRVAGRVFDERDGSGTLPVAIVNEAFVRTILDGADPLGVQLRAGPGDEEREWLTVVGVVGDVAVGGLDDEVRPLVYQPAAQSLAQPRNLVVVVRGAGQPGALVAAVRQSVAALDPAVPVHDAATLERIVVDSMGGHRLAAWLLASFAMTVMLLAGVGVYGIVAFITRASGAEFALRMALGARGADIAALIGRRGLSMAAAGIGAGTLLAAAALPVVASTLGQPLPAVLPVLALTAAALALVVGVACAGPAVRGARIDPSSALRQG